MSEEEEEEELVYFSNSIIIKLFHNISKFHLLTKEFCSLDPIRLNLISTIILSYSQRQRQSQNQNQGQSVTNERDYWWIIYKNENNENENNESENNENNENIIGIAIMTDSRPCILSPMPIYGIKEFSKYIFLNKIKLPAINGPIDVIDSFIDEYSKLKNEITINNERKIKLRMKQLIYVLKELNEPNIIKGRPHLLTNDDIELGVQYMKEFYDEVNLETNFNLYSFVESKIKSQTLYFWIDNINNIETIVAYGGHSLIVPPSDNDNEKSVARIGPIYTLLEYRCQGYGSYLTSYLTKKLLTGGHDSGNGGNGNGNCRVMLFADELNPSSNKVYQRLGYEICGDNIEYLFENEDEETKEEKSNDNEN